MVPPFVKRYLIALNRHKWAGFAGFAVVVGLSGVAAALQSPPPDTYLAQGILAYSAPPDIFSVTGAALQQQGQMVTKDVLLSSQVVDYAVQRLAAEQVPISSKEILSKVKVSTNNQPPASQDNAKPNQTETSTVLKVLVAYRDTDEATTKAIVGALMDGMVEQSRQFNTQQLNRILENLDRLLPRVTQELRQAEKNLETYVRREGTALQAAEGGTLLNNIIATQKQQRDLRLNLSGIDTQMSSLQGRLGLTPAQAYTSSALSADPLIADLRAKIYQAEMQRSLLSNTLRPDHPSMVELQNQLTTYNQLLQQRVTEVIGGEPAAFAASSVIRQASSLDPSRQQLATTLVGLATQRETVQQQLRALGQAEQVMRQEYDSLPNKQLEQQRLQQQVVLKQKFYDQIQARLADVKLAQEETVGSLVVIQPAATELQPGVGANSIVILAVGSLMGVLVGGGLILLFSAIDPTFHTLEEVQGALRSQEVPILGLLPILPWRDELDRLPVVDQPHSSYLDAYERLRSNLRRAGGGKALKLILVTSTVVGEGKTMTAYNLAIASARAGKRTLLIEADLRSPSHATSLHVTPDPDAVLDPLQYYSHLTECIHLVPKIENLYLVPSAGPQRHAPAILESSEMRRLLEDGRGRFDLVIIDTPALSRYNDALLLEPYTDGLLLVTRPGYTEEGLLNEAAQQFLESEDIQFLGAVINGAMALPTVLGDLEEEEDSPDTTIPDGTGEEPVNIGR